MLDNAIEKALPIIKENRGPTMEKHRFPNFELHCTAVLQIIMIGANTIEALCHLSLENSCWTNPSECYQLVDGCRLLD